MTSTLVVREPVPGIARWFSSLASGAAAVVLVVVAWGMQPPQRVLALVVAGVVAVAAVAFARSRAELRMLPGGIRIALVPLWRKTFPVGNIVGVRRRRVEPLPREWGNRGQARGPEGMLVGVGEVRDAVEFELRDGRRYSVTLDGERHDLEALVTTLRTHCGCRSEV